MATKSSSEIVRDGLWDNNPALVQVLGLCPLLAVTSTVVNAIGLGLATRSWHIYLAGGLGLVCNMLWPMLRGIMSKSVELHEQGERGALPPGLFTLNNGHVACTSTLRLFRARASYL